MVLCSCCCSLFLNRSAAQNSMLIYRGIHCVVWTLASSRMTPNANQHSNRLHTKSCQSPNAPKCVCVFLMRRYHKSVRVGAPHHAGYAMKLQLLSLWSNQARNQPTGWAHSSGGVEEIFFCVCSVPHLRWDLQISAISWGRWAVTVD